MKVLAVLLLCAFVAVQGRSAVEKSSKAVAAAGENPWIVHLRIAVATSGLLNSGVGSLISNRWVLTSASAVDSVRFVWIRYGVVNVISPELVTETTVVTTSPDVLLALISINRNVEYTDNIAAISLGGVVPESAKLALFGANNDGPGEILQTLTINLTQEDNTIIATSDEGKATKFDLGAPLVNEGSLAGVLVQEGGDDNAGVFVGVADYLDWIEEVSGVSTQPEDSLRVQFVN